MHEKKQDSTQDSTQEVSIVVSIVLMLLSLWCLWRSIFYGRTINILKFAVPGIALNLCAIIVVKRFKCFTAIPAYLLIALLMGYTSFTFVSNLHKRYFGNLYDAINTGDAEVVKRRIEEGYDVNARFLSKPLTHTVFFWYARAFNRDDPSPDLEVIEKKIVEMLEVLIDHGAKVDAVDDVRCWSLLFIAVAHCNTKAVQLLVEKGADVNLADKDGYTPLHYVQTPEIAQILIDKGANINARSKDGNTPLHMLNPTVAVQILIDGGADVNPKNEKGETPLDLAIKDGYEKMADLLRQNGAKE